MTGNGSGLFHENPRSRRANSPGKAGSARRPFFDFLPQRHNFSELNPATNVSIVTTRKPSRPERKGFARRAGNEFIQESAAPGFAEAGASADVHGDYPDHAGGWSGSKHRC